MEKFLYTLFVVLDGWVAGAAGFGAIILGRLAYLNQPGSKARRKLIYMGLAKAGYAITSVILLYAVAVVSAIESNPRVWAYLAGLLVAGIGFTGVAGIARDELAEFEEERDHPEEA